MTETSQQPDSRPSDGTAPAPAEAEDEKPELVTFQVKCAYVYLPLPPATSYGWRAELWDVEKWYKELRLRVVFVSTDDALYVRLHDQETDELFAECPLPSDGSPLTRSVEPVIDSSRYYVLRIVDRDDAKRHVYMGLGFRERSESSSFSAALDDYRQYLRRKAEAAQLQQEHAHSGSSSPARASSNGAGDGQESGSERSSAERTSSGKFKLADGQKLSLKLPGKASVKASLQEDDRASPLARRQVMRVFSLNESIAGIRLLPPPPPPGLPSATADWAVFTDTASSPRASQRQLSMRASGELPHVVQPALSGEYAGGCSPRSSAMAVTPGPRKPSAGDASKPEEEEWGEFK